MDNRNENPNIPDDGSYRPFAPDLNRAGLESIGPYRLIGAIGKGGMGEVYLAEQKTPIKRRVALKLIRLGMDTKEVIARFESERQALAMMNHPNIARIYDAGSTDTGRPYFVMEYVPGESITEYCDRHKLDLRSRLKLFIPVCQAIHHAHQKGIIHRDIKPSNVLVALEDSKPVPKVIDFGVAKATQQTLTEKTLFTSAGNFVGTPAYMSPEQAEMTGWNVDTTSDVYSLGVLLYELLVGAQPFDAWELRAAGIAEIHRIIREVDPPKPSTKIETLGEQATEFAERRQIELKGWRKQLNGELDWITMRAMEKDRLRRYPSASEFGSDIERYLQGEVIVACPPSTTYRLRKTIQRHRRFLLAIVGVFLALGVGLTFAVGFAYKAQQARRSSEWQAYLSGLRLAESALERNASAAALRALQGCPQNLRNWEWEYLSSQADLSEAVIFRFEDNAEHWRKRVVHWFPEGNRIALSVADSIIYQVNCTPPFSSSVLVNLSRPIDDFAFSPDGREIVAFAGGDSILHVIDCASGVTRLEIPIHEKRSYGRVFYSAELGEILKGDQFGLIRYDPRTGAELGRILDDGRRPKKGESFRLGKDVNYYSEWQVLDGGKRVAVCGPTMGDVPRVYDVVTGDLLGVPDDSLERSGFGGAVGAAGNWIAFSGYAKRDRTEFENRMALGIFDRTTLGTHVIGHQLPFTGAIDVSATQKEILAGFDDGTIRIWSAESGVPVAVLVGHNDRIYDLDIDRSDQRVVSVSRDGTVRLWDFEGILRKPLGEFIGDHEGVFVDSRKNSLYLKYSGYLFNWSLEDGKVTGSGKDLLQARSIQVLPTSWMVSDGTFFGCEGYQQKIFGSDSGSGAHIYSPRESLKTVTISGEGSVDLLYVSTPPDSVILSSSAISGDGSLFAISRWATKDGYWRDNVQVQRQIRSWHSHNYEVRSFIGGETLAMANEEGPIVTALAIDKSCRKLAVGTESGLSYILDLKTNEKKLLGDIHTSRVNDVVFGLDGHILAIASADRTISVWSVDDGKFLTSMVGHKGGVASICLDQSRRRLYSRSSDQTLRSWDLVTGDLLLTIREGRYDPLYRGIALADGGRLLIAPRKSGAIIIDPRRPFPMQAIVSREPEIQLPGAGGH